LADFNQRADLSLETADELEAYHAEQEELIESLNEELAEQGVDDLADIEELTAEQAADFIMAARNICWFSEE